MVDIVVVVRLLPVAWLTWLVRTGFWLILKGYVKSN
jgi:hypothetical protein